MNIEHITDRHWVHSGVFHCRKKREKRLRVEIVEHLTTVSKVGGRDPSDLAVIFDLNLQFVRLARLRYPAVLIALSPGHMLEAS